MAEINNFGRLFNGVSLDKFNTTSSASLYLVLDFVSMKTKYNSQETSHRLGFNFDYYTVTFWLSFCHIKSLKYRFLITMCLLTEWKGCRGNIQLEFRPSRVKCPCIMTESQIFSHAAYPNSSISILLFDCHSSLCPFFLSTSSSLSHNAFYSPAHASGYSPQTRFFVKCFSISVHEAVRVIQW